MTGELQETERNCLRALKDSYQKYLVHGPQSTQKIIPLHGWVIEELQDRLDSDFNVIGKGKNLGKELKIDGMYYPKNVDVAVNLGDTCIGVVSIKFICSNFRQNANNYFEGQIGETANLRRNNIVFGHILCFRHPIPYLEKNGKLKKYEVLNDKDIAKYFSLFNDHQHLHSPDAQAIIVLHAGTSYKKSTDKIIRFQVKEDLELSEKYYKLLKNNFNINQFFKIFVEKTKIKRIELKI